jgi:hypothetical protein
VGIALSEAARCRGVVKLAWAALVTVAAALAGACDDSSNGGGVMSSTTITVATTTTTSAAECRTFEDCPGPGDCECQSGMCACVTLPTSSTSMTTSTLAIDQCFSDGDCFDFGIDCSCESYICHCTGQITAEIEFELLSDVPVGALQLQIDYAAADDVFRGTDDLVKCQSFTDAIASFNDDENARIVTAGFISLTGIGGSGAQRFMRCTVEVIGEPPVVEEYTITVTDAADVNVVPITPLPVVRISGIDVAGTGLVRAAF